MCESRDIKSIEESVPKYRFHKEFCDKLHKLYVAKNRDYGDSFQKVRKEYPEAIAIRLMDKLERIKQLLKGHCDSTRQVSDESIEDTLLDLANYCLLELVERRNDSEGRCIGEGSVDNSAAWVNRYESK